MATRLVPALSEMLELSEFKANSKPALVVREIDQIEGAACGNCASRPKAHGRHMEGTWKAHGRHMEGTWEWRLFASRSGLLCLPFSGDE
jgi:hypothetical protein